ncbi:MAG: glycosyltransferase family 4 protein [Candidatus Velthaea sp.]
MNILLLNWRDPENPRAGGAEVYLHEIAQRWVRGGHRVEWIAAGFRGAPRRTEIDGITIQRVGTAVTVYFAAGIEYVLRMRKRFDVIVDAENGIPFFSPLYVSKPKVLLVHHVHTDVFKTHLPRTVADIFIWLESTLMPRIYSSVSFVAVSESTRSEVERQSLTKRPVAVIHNGVASDLLVGVKSAIPTLAYVGRLKRYKRVDLLLVAAARLRVEYPNLVVRIAGRGDDEPYLRERVAELGLEDCVTFEGFITHERKREILQEAWIFVTPSEMEGWGITIIEANACGTPAVGFNVPGVRESIRDGLSGLLVESEAELVTMLGALLRDTTWRLRLSENAINRAKDFSWDRAAVKLLELITNEAS